MTLTPQVLKKDLESEVFVQKFEDVNELKLNVKREISYAVQLVMKNNLLQQCDANTVKQAIFNAASTGFTLNPTLQQAHLVPRRVKGQWHCFLEPDYKGLITKLIDFGVVKDVYAYVVYEGDEFDIQLGTEKKLIHKPYYALGKEQGKEIGGYAVAILPDGSKKFEYQPWNYFESIMECSESYKGDKKNNTKYSPWNNAWRPDMVKKTMVRYLWKTLPKSQQDNHLTKVIELEDQANAVDFDEAGRQATKEHMKTLQQSGVQDAVKRVNKIKEQKEQRAKLKPKEEVEDAIEEHEEPEEETITVTDKPNDNENTEEEAQGTEEAQSPEEGMEEKHQEEGVVEPENYGAALLQGKDVVDIKEGERREDADAAIPHRLLVTQLKIKKAELDFALGLMGYDEDHELMQMKVADSLERMCYTFTNEQLAAFIDRAVMNR